MNLSPATPGNEQSTWESRMAAGRRRGELDTARRGREESMAPAHVRFLGMGNGDWGGDAAAGRGVYIRTERRELGDGRTAQFGHEYSRRF